MIILVQTSFLSFSQYTIEMEVLLQMPLQTNKLLNLIVIQLKILSKLELGFQYKFRILQFLKWVIQTNYFLKASFMFLQPPALTNACAK